MLRSLQRFVVILVSIASLTTSTPASVYEARIPLHDHKLREEDLTAMLLHKLHLPGIGFGSVSIDLDGLCRSDFVEAMNAALAGGGHVSLDGEELIFRLDPARLPRNIRALKHAIETFTATMTPQATANQRRTYGLTMPPHVDPHRPIVILVHGLDCNRSNWYAMADLLDSAGYQVAYFCYPSDGPIKDSAAMFARHMQAVHEIYPDMPLDVIAHSMGGLLSRDYIEGNDYTGGVKHLIMLGTPNLGSRWAAYRIVLEWQEHYELWRHEPDWSPTWMITDGLGEAGADLNPRSDFLRELNARPRRAGVVYTIIAGDEHPVGEITACALNDAAQIAPNQIARWWGVRQTEAFLHRGADKVRDHTFKSDGPVSVASTKLAGVDDYVLVKADHNGLYLPEHGAAPAAWNIILDRLSH